MDVSICASNVFNEQHIQQFAYESTFVFISVGLMVDNFSFKKDQKIILSFYDSFGRDFPLRLFHTFNHKLSSSAQYVRPVTCCKAVKRCSNARVAHIV